MANEKQAANNIEYALIDTAPASGGFWTNSVSMRNKKVEKLFFSIRESVDGATSAVTPIVQFKCYGDAHWTDYYNGGNAWNVGEREVIEGVGAAVSFRAGVKEGGLSSGGVILGFDW